MIISFRFCTVELHLDEQLVITRFPDGTCAHACPHETPQYHAHALEKTGVDDIMLYCWQHDIAHILHGEIRNRPSVVLWALAHNEDTDTEPCRVEESEAQELQRNFQMRP